MRLQRHSHRLPLLEAKVVGRDRGTVSIVSKFLESLKCIKGRGTVLEIFSMFGLGQIDTPTPDQNEDVCWQSWEVLTVHVNHFG